MLIILLVCLFLTGCQKEAAAQEDMVSENNVLDTGSASHGEEETDEALAEPDQTLWEDVSNWEAPYVEAYYEFLQEYVKGCSDEERKHGRFYLAFIDDDEIPELLVIDDDIAAAGVKVFTYDQEAVVDMGEFGSMGTMRYAEKEGMIVSSFTGMGELYDSYYQMADKEAVLICNTRSYPDYSQDDPYEKLLYEIDGVLVSEEEYDEKWHEFEKNFEFTTIGYDDGISINEADLKSRLLDVIDDIELKRGSGALQIKTAEWEEVLKAYELFLNEYAKYWEDYEGENGPVFSLIYLNEDTIPELVVFDGVAHASSAQVYTYESEETVHIGDYGEYGATSYIEGEGIMLSFYDNGGNLHSTIYQVEGTDETILQSFDQLWDFNEDAWTYRLDGKDVSKEQYDAAYSVWDQYAENNEKIIAYDMCRPVLSSDIKESLTEALEDLILGQKTALQSRLLVESGMQEEEILLFEYDDYNYDGKYEAFVFCGTCDEDESGSLYSGALWFVGTDTCVRLSQGDYRSIDGKMNLGGRGQKYVYLNNEENHRAVKTEIWTVDHGEPVESPLSGTGELTYDPYSRILAIWTEADDHFYDPETDLWTGNTYKPCFYSYHWTTDKIESCQGKEISWLKLKQLCGFHLTEEIEGEGYEVVSIIQWDEKIVTVTYAIPPDEGDTVIQYENVIWDCSVKDYWRKEERGVTSWKDAGVGGKYSL